MKPRRAAGAAVAATIVLAAAAGPAAGAQSPGSGATASVIGGRTASIAEFPWLAFIVGKAEHGDFTCTGTVVAPRVVLTAGHCVRHERELVANAPARFRVITGTADVSQATAANVSTVSRAIFHPTFDTAKLQTDAGLLVLSAPVAAPPLAIASGADAAVMGAGTPISIAGWGLTDPGARMGPAALRAGELVLRPQAACRREIRPYEPFYSPAGQLCALDTPDHAVSGCFGDSGGPAIAKRADGTPVEIGIVVSGGPDCSRRLPNIYTKIARISGWVSGWIASAETGAPAPPVPKVGPPRLTIEEARLRTALILGKVLPRDREFNGTLRCARRGWAKVTCRLTGRLGKRRYRASITVFYEVRGYDAIPRTSVRVHSGGA